MVNASHKAGDQMKSKLFVFLLLLCAACLSATAADTDKVTISQDETSFTLDNGIISARISKRSGSLTALEYKRFHMFDEGGSSSGGYWSYDVSREQRTSQITIDPATNDGQRGEVAVKGVFSGHLGSGPAVDIEFRYSLASGDSGLYAYCVFSHP